MFLGFIFSVFMINTAYRVDFQVMKWIRQLLANVWRLLRHFGIIDLSRQNVTHKLAHRINVLITLHCVNLPEGEYIVKRLSIWLRKQDVRMNHLSFWSQSIFAVSIINMYHQNKPIRDFIDTTHYTEKPSSDNSTKSFLLLGHFWITK